MKTLLFLVDACKTLFISENKYIIWFVQNQFGESNMLKIYNLKNKQKYR